MDSKKVFYIDSTFTTKELASVDEKIDSIFIEGYASTNDVDRTGDVIPTSVWEKGITNYLKNPIILAYHDHDDPVGRMVEHKIDTTGLWIKARISAAAEIFNLVKDGVLTAFSVGFRILDAEYNAAAEIFVVKDLELVEISVVSVPMNQNTTFNLAKAFESADDFTKFKMQFAPEDNSAKGLEASEEANSTTQKEWNMNPEEIKVMLADAAKSAAEEATKQLLAKQAEEKAKAEAEAKAQAELEARIKAAVESRVTTVDTGAEKLLAEVTKRMEEQKASLDGLEAALKEKADELAKIQASKMQFSPDKKEEIPYAEKEKAVLLSVISRKAIADTKYGKDLMTKALGASAATGAHLASQTWEHEVSLNMEAEIRRRLVMAPLLRNIQMQTNIMSLPINPEAGYATWIQNNQFGTTASPGSAQTHQLKELTLNAYKVATMEYVAYEEEEDSLIVLLPVIRDAMIRRVAKAVDKAYLRGAGSAGDPVTGISVYDATSAVTVTNTSVATASTLRALRKDLGAWGLVPQELVFVVSTDVYYDLLEDTTFQTMDKVGPMATLLTGQIGMIGQTPVIVSAEFPAKAGGSSSAATNIAAMCFAPGNFLACQQRGLRFDTQDLVETQRRVLVASLRTGLSQVTTIDGMGVSTLRWS